MPVKTIVATGTYAEHILPYCEKDIKYNKHLLLEGLKYIYDRNEQKQKIVKGVKDYEKWNNQSRKTKDMPEIDFSACVDK